MESIEYKVVDMSGKQTGTVALDSRIFQAPILEHLVHDVVVWQRNKKRAGTAAAQVRSEMEGGGRKPWKQKGTGRARAGSNISPVWVGGAVVFGPQPRDYTTRVSRRSRKQALTSVLSEKVKTETLVVLDDIVLSGMRTKEIASLLSSVGAGEKKSLIVLKGDGDERETVIEKSARNIPGVKILPVAGLNVYDLLNHKYLVCTKDGIQNLQEQIASRKG